MKWIRVEDRLPEEYTIVILHSASTGTEFGVWNGKEWHDRDFHGGPYVCDNVTHWQPLPDDPKVENDNSS